MKRRFRRPHGFCDVVSRKHGARAAAGRFCRKGGGTNRHDARPWAFVSVVSEAYVRGVGMISRTTT